MFTPSVRTVKLFLGLLGLSILIAFILSLDLFQVLDKVRRMGVMTAGLILISYLFSYCTRLIKWSLFLKIPIARFFRIYAIQVTLGVITPLRAGEVAHVSLVGALGKETLAVRTGRFLFLRTLEIMIYFLFVFLASLYLGLYVKEVQIGLLVIALAAAVLVPLYLAGPGRSARVRKFVSEMVDVFKVNASLKTIAGLTLLTCIQHLFEWTSAVIAIRALTSCSAPTIVSAYFLASFAGILSLIPGGLGVGSVTWAYILHLSCADLLAAGSASVVHKLLTLGLIGFLALVSLILCREKKQSAKSEKCYKK